MFYIINNSDTVPLAYYNQLKKIFNSNKYNIYWKNLGYQLKKDKNNIFYVEYLNNNNCIPLHGEVEKNKVLKNHKIEDFIFIDKITNEQVTFLNNKAKVVKAFDLSNGNGNIVITLRVNYDEDFGYISYLSYNQTENKKVKLQHSFFKESMVASINQLIILNKIEYPLISSEEDIKNLIMYLGTYYHVEFETFETYDFNH